MSDLLRVLSDCELLSRTRDLVALERAVTLRLLLHLNEIERRQLHLEQGFSSMFDYCTSGLGYSEPAAFRRMRTARCIARFPEVLSLLEANKLSLSTVTRVSRALTESNKDSLLARVIGCSVRKVDEIVAEYLPVTQLRDLVRAVVVQTPKGSGFTLLATTAPPEDASARRAPEQTERPPQTDCEKNAYCRVEGTTRAVSAVRNGRRRSRIALLRALRHRTRSLPWSRPLGATFRQRYETKCSLATETAARSPEDSAGDARRPWACRSITSFRSLAEA